MAAFPEALIDGVACACGPPSRRPVAAAFSSADEDQAGEEHRSTPSRHHPTPRDDLRLPPGIDHGLLSASALGGGRNACGCVGADVERELDRVPQQHLAPLVELL